VRGARHRIGCVQNVILGVSNCDLYGLTRHVVDIRSGEKLTGEDLKEISNFNRRRLERRLDTAARRTLWRPGRDAVGIDLVTNEASPRQQPTVPRRRKGLHIRAPRHRGGRSSDFPLSSPRNKHGTGCFRLNDGSKRYGLLKFVAAFNSSSVPSLSHRSGAHVSDFPHSLAEGRDDLVL
jgi:hypothetical protein